MIPQRVYAAEYPYYISQQIPAIQIQLARLTTFGEDGNSRRRMEAVKIPVRYGQVSKLIEHTFDNDLTTGFRFAAVIGNERYDHKDEGVMVEDPRGFAVHISAANAAQLMLNARIENGEILDNCVWVQDKRTMNLVVEGSSQHEDAKRLTKLSHQKVVAQDCSPGDVLTLQSGEDVLYLGLYHFVASKGTRTYWRNTDETAKIGGVTKRHLYVNAELTPFVCSHDILKLISGEETVLLSDGRKFTGCQVLSVGNLKVADIVTKSRAVIDTTRVAEIITEASSSYDIARMLKMDRVTDIVHCSNIPYGNVKLDIEPVDKKPTRNDELYCWKIGDTVFGARVSSNSRPSSTCLDLDPLFEEAPGKEVTLKYVNLPTALADPKQFYRLVLKTDFGSIHIKEINH